jgi:hypothetical protein
VPDGEHRTGDKRLICRRVIPFGGTCLAFPSEPTRQPCDHDQRRQGGAAPARLDLDDGANTHSSRRSHLRALRAFLRPLPFDEGVTAAIEKSSIFFPPLMAAVSHRGFNPRPAHVSAGFSGLRYLGATDPLGPPRPNADFARPAPPWKRSSFESSASRAWRCSVTLGPETK